MLLQQQPWTVTPNNMPQTRYYSDGSPARDMLDVAALASPPTRTGVDWTIVYPAGTPVSTTQGFVEADYPPQLARLPSPSVMSVDSFPEIEFGGLCHTGSSTGRVGSGSQDMVGVGGPFSLVEGPGVGYYSMAYDCWEFGLRGDVTSRVL
jgi:hypothetical protein